MNQRHRHISEIPQQEKISVVIVCAARIFLPECDAVEASHRGVTHDSELGEIHVDGLAGIEDARQPFDVFALGAEIVNHLAVVAYCRSRPLARTDYMADYYEGVVAENLTYEVNVACGVGGTQMLAESCAG